MDISVEKTPVDFSVSANKVQKNLMQSVVSPADDKNYVTDKSLVVMDDEFKKKPVDLNEVSQMTEAMNKFVHAMDANIRFKVHEESNQLMVQVIDQANQKVLKEFPSSEFLDTIAAIRDYVGILLDEKI